jgi:HEAT repeat protein
MSIGRSRLTALAFSATLCSVCHAADGPPPGNAPNKEWLKQVIKETIAPELIDHKPLPRELQGLRAWSQPANGLAARIDNVWDGTGALVRLKNVSDRPLRVPTGNPAGEQAARLIVLHVRQGSHPWRKLPVSRQYGQYFANPKSSPGGKRKPTDPPWVTLRPGEEAVAFVATFDAERTGDPKFIKAVLRLSDDGAAASWSGVLETPSRPLELSREQSRALRQSLPFPNHFPPLSYEYLRLPNGPAHEPEARLLHNSNQPLIDMLANYEPAGVQKEFERRMRVENVMPMKLLLASVAATAGSEEAAIFFLDTMQETDYLTVTNLQYALMITYWNYVGGPPDWQRRDTPAWLVELSLAILDDHRSVTGLEKTNYKRGTSFTVASQARGLRSAISHAKSRKNIPLLIKRLKMGKVDGPTLTALAASGDKRAIPPLIEWLKTAATAIQYDSAQGVHGDFVEAANALATLRSREAAPVLLKYVEYPEIIACLAKIGDAQSLPTLREVVNHKGKIVRDGQPVNPELEDRRMFAARMALARFEGADEVPRLVEMLADSTLTRDQRYAVVMRLAGQPDPRAIPHLVRVIQTDPDYYIIDLAIEGLAERKDKAAVKGLIDCFDVPFASFDLGKGGVETPETIRNRIARSLRRLTDQTIGPEKDQWQKWWQEAGRNSAALK